MRFHYSMQSRKKKYRKFRVRLLAADRKKLNLALHQSDGPNRIFKRAMILRLLDRGKSVSEIADDLGVNEMSVRNVGGRYIKFGFKRALGDRSRSGRPPKISDRQEKEIIALACSSPPNERARWTLTLLRDEVVGHWIVPAIGRETLRNLLHEAKVKPWLEKNVVHWGADRRVHPQNEGYS